MVIYYTDSLYYIICYDVAGLLIKIPQGTIREHLRCSVAKAFLRPARNRPNLHIAMLAHVHRVLIDDSNRAYGVVFERNRRLQRILVRKEVIMSAGAIGSPQLLMLSGIGPSSDLQQVGVAVKKDLPGVGHNLQDHISGRGMVYLIDQPVSYLEARFINLPTVLDYYINRRGPMTALSGTEGLAWVHSKYSNPA